MEQMGFEKEDRIKFNKLIGKRIKELRVEFGISVETLCFLSGVPRSSIANLEAEKGDNGLSLFYLFLIARTLRVDFNKILPVSEFANSINVVVEHNKKVLLEKQKHKLFGKLK